MIIYFCRNELGIMMEKYSSMEFAKVQKSTILAQRPDEQKGFYSPQYPRKEAKQ
jgi:hypothetical protein